MWLQAGASTIHNATTRPTTHQKAPLAFPITYRLNVEPPPRTGPRHRENGERVPLRRADSGAVDLDVRASLESVASAREVKTDADAFWTDIVLIVGGFLSKGARNQTTAVQHHRRLSGARVTTLGSLQALL